jgi:hypothetical protein
VQHHTQIDAPAFDLAVNPELFALGIRAPDRPPIGRSKLVIEVADFDSALEAHHHRAAGRRCVQSQQCRGPIAIGQQRLSLFGSGDQKGFPGRGQDPSCAGLGVTAATGEQALQGVNISLSDRVEQYPSPRGVGRIVRGDQMNVTKGS